MKRSVLLMMLVCAVAPGIAGCSASAPETDRGATPAPAPQEGTPATPADGGTEAPFALTSPAFSDGAPLPAASAMKDAGGTNASPALAWEGAPEGTKSFALVCIDTHPIAGGWVHWVVVDLPAETTSLPEGASGGSMLPGARELKNGFGEKGWGGPLPPEGSGAHDYVFTLYALDVPTLDVADGATIADVNKALEQHTLAKATLTGTFQR